MAIKEIERTWSPSQCDYVKHYLCHDERDVKDLPKCCVGSRATVSNTDYEYVCTECGWVRADFVELAAICPEILTDPDVKILYDPEKTEVGESEFANNADIEVVYFPNVQTIGNKAFEYATNLRAAIFPMATTLGNYCFRSCKNLEFVCMPNVQSIAVQVFVNTSKLKEINLPEVTSIKMRSFDGMDGLETASLVKLTTTLGSCFSTCAALKNVNLPKITKLNGSDFSGCTSLTKLDLLEVTDINCRALTNSGVEALILRAGTVCTLDSTFRAGTPIADGTGYIYVPAALIEDYKAATNWSTYANQFRAIEDYPEVCDPEWDGHSGDVVIPAGKTLTIQSGATVNDEAGVLGGSGGDGGVKTMVFRSNRYLKAVQGDTTQTDVTETWECTSMTFAEAAEYAKNGEALMAYVQCTEQGQHDDGSLAYTPVMTPAIVYPYVNDGNIGAFGIVNDSANVDLYFEANGVFGE